MKAVLSVGPRRPHIPDNLRYAEGAVRVEGGARGEPEGDSLRPAGEGRMALACEPVAPLLEETAEEKAVLLALADCNEGG